VTPEQIATLLTLPGIAALIFIVVRQQAMIDRLVDANTALIAEFMKLHPPQELPSLEKP